MNTEQIINEFVEKEKLMQPNPFLATRIMTKLERSKPHTIKVWQSLVVAASISFVVITGIGIGNTYKSASNYSELNLNDSKLENFSFYNFTENE